MLEQTQNHIIQTPYIGYVSISDLDIANTLTSCGACAVCMILSLHKIKTDIKTFVEEGHKNGGYTEHGWLHSYLVQQLKENNINYKQLEKCQPEESFKMIKESILANNPVIVSVKKLCLEQISFHMILLVGIKFEGKNEVAGFYYHDPAATTVEKGSYRYVPKETFSQFWRNMMIIKE